MKLKSLILGSVAAAGLSTAGYAADLGVLTSLDVCDALGLSGLTISSDTNCLQISGGVEYEFSWGDYQGDDWDVNNSHDAGDSLNDAFNIDDNNGVSPDELDWFTKVEYWLKFVGTADSDFGPAKAVIKIKERDDMEVINEGPGGATGAGVLGGAAGDTGDDTGGVELDEAYVAVGDATVLMAGKKGSIGVFGDDEPFNFLGLFGSEQVDTGVAFDIDLPGGIDMGDLDTGGHVIQVVSDLGNGVSVGLGLENINAIDSMDLNGDGDELDAGEVDTPLMAGTLVGVVTYTGESITAHLTGLAGGVLDGDIEAYAVHAGVTGTFDMFKLRAAVGANTDTITDDSAWNALISGEANFDIFRIALSGEAAGGTGFDTNYGFGGSIGADVTDGVAINLGGRYYENNNGGDDGYQIAAQLVAAVTETITLTGEVGMYGNVTEDDSDFYGAAEVAWAPGGGFTSSLKGEAHQNGAYKVTFKAAKTFE